MPQVIPDPRANIREYTRLMRQYAPLASLDTDAREIFMLAREGYKAEASALAQSRQELNQSEREALNEGGLMAGLVGGMKGVAGAGGFSGGAALGTMAAPFTGPFAPVMPVLGGMVGAMAGVSAVEPGLEAAGVAPAQLEATMQANPGMALAGTVAGGLAVPAALAGKAMFTKVTQGAAKAASEARVAKMTEDALIRRANAEARIKELQESEETIRLANPQRAASSNARHARIQAESLRAIAEANKAEAEAAILQARAAGNLSAADQAKLDLLYRTLNKTDLQVEILRQNMQSGTFKVASERLVMDRLKTQVRITENLLTRTGAQAGIAGAEAATKLQIMKAQLALLEQRLGADLVAPGSSAAALMPPAGATTIPGMIGAGSLAGAGIMGGAALAPSQTIEGAPSSISPPNPDQEQMREFARIMDDPRFSQQERGIASQQAQEILRRRLGQP